MIKKVLILSDRNFQSAPRIIREIFILEKSFKVFTSNFISYRDNHIYRKKSPLLLLDRIFNKLYKLFKGHYYYKNLPFRSIFLARFYKKYLFDLIIIHEPELLPYVDFLKKKFQVKVVFNAHEYHPLEFENDLIWKKKYGKQYEYLYYNYLKKLDLLVNVCDGIAFECKRSFNVSSIVVPNASFYHNVEVKEVQENFKVIHHGACI
ncbi:MAG: hypothetical protein H0U27_10005, partial [Nitrosopumilus sp.]|nr:hypothetical protein [Nitrosopumilus sp.]